MAKRGRKSAAELQVFSPNLAVIERLKAPHDLSDEETEVWHAVAGAKSADWFDAATAPLLAQYCRHTVHARRIAEMIEKYVDQEGFTLKAYNAMLVMQQRESAAMASLATKMRISQQSTTNHRGNRVQGAAAVRKPWDI